MIYKIPVLFNINEITKTWCFQGNNATCSSAYDCGSGPSAIDVNCHNGDNNSNWDNSGQCTSGSAASGNSDEQCSVGGSIQTVAQYVCANGLNADSSGCGSGNTPTGTACSSGSNK